MEASPADKIQGRHEWMSALAALSKTSSDLQKKGVPLLRRQPLGGYVSPAPNTRYTHKKHCNEQAILVYRYYLLWQVFFIFLRAPHPVLPEILLIPLSNRTYITVDKSR